VQSFGVPGRILRDQASVEKSRKEASGGDLAGLLQQLGGGAEPAPQETGELLP
jgi:hypothetical protein